MAEMNSNYVAEIQYIEPLDSTLASWMSNVYPTTCIRQHICILVQVAGPGYMCPCVHAALDSGLAW